MSPLQIFFHMPFCMCSTSTKQNTKEDPLEYNTAILKGCIAGQYVSSCQHYNHHHHQSILFKEAMYESESGVMKWVQQPLYPLHASNKLIFSNV